MAPIAPAPEEMDRMQAPPILANLTMGGAVFIREEKGMLLSPAGMLTAEKAIQNCCCPGCLQVAFAYTDGAYTQGIQVDSKPAGCCGKPHWTISKKDYTAAAADEDLGRIGKAAVAKMRAAGKSEAAIAKLYPAKVMLAKTVKDQKKSCGKSPWGIKLPDGAGLHYHIKNKPKCCGTLLACPLLTNCRDGIGKGKFCMNFQNPIYDGNNNKIAYIVQTVPLIPTSCCTAAPGPTLQMAIHKHPECTQALSEDDISRLSLFMFTVVPNIPGRGGGAGPVKLVNMTANVILAQTGWALGFGMTEVEEEYLSFNQVFNGEIASIGDLIESIRGGK